MKLIKEIKSKDGEVHFRRWRLLQTPWLNIYIHGIYQPDHDRHLHDHPWNICTIILKGGYIEKYWCEKHKREIHKPRGLFNIGYRKAEEFHKIAHLLTKEVFTLDFVGKRKRVWGYKTEKGWVDHKTYRKNKNKKRD